MERPGWVRGCSSEPVRHPVQAAPGRDLVPRGGWPPVHDQRRRAFRLDADRGHALAGDDHPLGSAVATEDADQAPVAEAVHHLVEGTALEREAVRQRQDREVGALRGGLAAAILGILSVAMVAGARIWVWPFSGDPEVILLAASMLAIMAAFLIFDGLQYVFGAALRSLGEQVWAGVNGMIGFFLVTGGLGWWLVRSGWGPDGLAWAAGLGMLVAGTLQLARLAWVLRKPARTPG